MVRERGFESYTPFSVALNHVMALIKPLPPVSVPFTKAQGCVVAEDVVALENIPSFSRAAVDGYAVQASSTFGASQNRPVRLKLIKKSRTGMKFGWAVPIATGSPLPKGADAVVMLERAIIRKEEVEVLSPVTPGRNVSREGEDVRKGEIVIKTGSLLRAQEIGMLAQLRKLKVRVHPRPKIALIITGSELVVPRSRKTPEKTVDVNSYTLTAAVEECGGKVMSLKRISENPEKLERELQRGLSQDLIMISGGSSVGKEDFTPEVVGRLGKMVFHGVAMRPGSPTAFAFIRGKPVFCLPGFPAAALLAFHIFVKPAISKLRGLTVHHRKTIKAALAADVNSALGRADILRVKINKLEDRVLAEPIRITGSGILSSLVRADGFVVIPENVEKLAKGDTVEVELF